MLISPLIVPELYHVSVSFEDDLNLNEITSKLNVLHSPHVVLWYIGCYGLKKACVDFYRKNLISPVFVQHSEATFWLTDLTAWTAFKSRTGSIHKTSACCQVIQNFNDYRIKCLPSSDMFKRMLEMTDQNVIEHFTELFIKKPFEHLSNNQPSIGITVGEIFPNPVPVLNALENQDVSKAYSAIQFLEGCLIIETIVKTIAQNSHTNFAEIVFALPNDELKYYSMEKDIFNRSIELLLVKTCHCLGINCFDLRVSFLAFNFGEHLEHRPYNIPGNCVRKNELSVGDVTGKASVISDFPLKYAY